jgi:hypothetical protein
MLKEEYFGVVAEVNSAYLKSIIDLIKPCFPYNLEYSSNKASGISSPYEGYILAEFRHPSSSYEINESFIPFI